MKKDNKRNMPNTPHGWIAEIVEAYYDAYEAIPFGLLTGQKITEKELFHMAPHICLKFRKIKRTKTNVDKATEAMLSSYVATEDQNRDIFTNPHLAFSFVYLACHYGMGLLTEDKVAEIMKYLEGQQSESKEAIEKKIKKNDV